MFSIWEKWILVYVMQIVFYRKILENPLSKNTYQKRFSILMNVEELQMQVDIRRYDMTDAPMKKCPHNKRLLMLEVRHDKILLCHLHMRKPCTPCHKSSYICSRWIFYSFIEFSNTVYTVLVILLNGEMHVSDSFLKKLYRIHF